MADPCSMGIGLRADIRMGAGAETGDCSIEGSADGDCRPYDHGTIWQRLSVFCRSGCSSAYLLQEPGTAGCQSAGCREDPGQCAAALWSCGFYRNQDPAH